MVCLSSTLFKIMESGDNIHLQLSLPHLVVAYAL